MESNRLREIREKRGMAMRELAARSTVAVSTLHNIERYGSSARPSTWQKIADALGVNVAEIRPSVNGDTPCPQPTQ